MQGTSVRLRLERPGAVGEIDLGESARFYPSDPALAMWRQISQGGCELVYAAEGA